MDLEAMQFLNLSPIPELSEIELSTMLDHLSGLSDINGDLTDRNVEDIIKEAEDLLDRSVRNKSNESSAKGSEAEEKTANDLSQDVNSLKETEECNTQKSDFDESQQMINTVNDLPHNTSSEDNHNKHFNSPVESTKSGVCSYGGSANLIKSTIDSLKEFSSLVEKKPSSQFLNSSQKYNETGKPKEKKLDTNAEVKVGDTQSKEKLGCTNKMFSNLKVIQTPDLTKENKPVDKSVVFLNCFERLYQVKPARICSSKKPKVVDKTTKTGTKKKLFKDLKNVKKNIWQGKPVKNTLQEGTKKVKSHSLYLGLPNLNEDENSFKHDTSKIKHFSDDCNILTAKESKTAELEIQSSSGHDLYSNDYKSVQPSIDEKLILKVLEEVEEIKDQVRKAWVINDDQNSKKKMKESSRITDRLKPEVESTGEELLSVKVESFGIKRLEEQFAMLKEKYDYQMEKLEAENLRLREALNSPKNFDANTISSIAELGLFPENKILPSFGYATDKKITRSISLENCKAPKNSPYSSQENINTSVTQREACSQTENESDNIIQESKGVGTEEIGDPIPEKKTENKENIKLKKKPGKCKPFSDVNVQQLIRQKKTFDHESQLLAIIRGLQSEVTAKDKENRRLKTEMESLKKQMKKTNVKGENFRRYHVGTQTIGFGPFVQKPYNPEHYEVPSKFEKENEDLRSRINALEEDFELLKEKRISDLQALHQVHEEEMAKLVSKLETQSALTRHLHSLLVNR